MSLYFWDSPIYGSRFRLISQSRFLFIQDFLAFASNLLPAPLSRRIRVPHFPAIKNISFRSVFRQCQLYCLKSALVNNGHAENTARSRTANCKRVCEYEGDLDKLYKADHCQNLLNRLKYTSEDQAHNQRTLHAVPIDGNIYNSTATLRSAVNLYIEFLKNRNTATSSGKQQSNVQPNHLLSEYEAIQICRNNGLPITECKNFASKNTRAPVYWTNPIIDRLRHDWWLILNDDIRCILYVFLHTGKYNSSTTGPA